MMGRRHPRGRQRGVALITALLIGGLLAIHGYEKVSNRLDDFSSGSLETLDRHAARRTIWAAVAKAMRIGIEAACRPGIVRISAGNYGGTLGQYQFHLHELMSD